MSFRHFQCPQLAIRNKPEMVARTFVGRLGSSSGSCKQAVAEHATAETGPKIKKQKLEDSNLVGGYAVSTCKLLMTF